MIELEEGGEAVVASLLPQGISVYVIENSFTFGSFEAVNLSGKIGYGNIIFNVDGVQASQVTVEETNADSCRVPFTGIIQVKVQDISSYGKNERFTFDFEINKSQQ